MFSKNVLVCFLGNSKSGKSRLMIWCEKHFQHRIHIMRSSTTRDKKPTESLWLFRKFYHQTSVESFREGVQTGRYVEYDEYGGNLYGTTHEALKRTLSRSHGMVAVTEKAIPALRENGVNIIIVKIVPLNAELVEDELRRQEDAERDGTIAPDYTIFNDFLPGGFEKSCAELAGILKPYVKKA